MKEIFETVVGSYSYGTNLPTSDIDIKGVYIQDTDDILGIKYKEQVDKDKDTVFYEVKRFLELCAQGNPNILELLYPPEDCIIFDAPQMRFIREHREIFLTQRCKYSFGGYAVAQIKKAKGLNKKINWDKRKIERKTPLDFCYIVEGTLSKPLVQYLKENGFDQKYCGLSKINNFYNSYFLFYDYRQEYIDSGVISSREVEGDGYRGIIGDNSNDLRLSSIPKGAIPESILYFNRDGYSSHCKDFREYQEWLKERNEQRYVDTIKHGQKIDGKNLMHCMRLIHMAKEIALDKRVNVRRPDADYLLDIRHGKVDLDTIIEEAENELEEIENLKEWEDLPKKCDMDKVHELLVEVRKM